MRTLSSTTSSKLTSPITSFSKKPQTANSFRKSSSSLNSKFGTKVLSTSRISSRNKEENLGQKVTTQHILKDIAATSAYKPKQVAQKSSILNKVFKASNSAVSSLGKFFSGFLSTVLGSPANGATLKAATV